MVCSHMQKNSTSSKKLTNGEVFFVSVSAQQVHFYLFCCPSDLLDISVPSSKTEISVLVNHPFCMSFSVS